MLYSHFSDKHHEYIYMILKDPVHVVWNALPSILQYFIEIYPLLYSWWMKTSIIHACQETLRHLASCFHLLLYTNASTPSEFVTQNISVTWNPWSKYSFRFLEQSVIISGLIPVPCQKVYLRKHIVHPILLMWMPSNFDLYNVVLSTTGKFNRMLRNVLWCL